MAERTSELHGSWQLISFNTELQESNERTQPWGADPNGRMGTLSPLADKVLVASRSA